MVKRESIPLVVRLRVEPSLCTEGDMVADEENEK